MKTKDIIKDLCKAKGISVNKLEKDLGFGTGYVSKLDKSIPNVKKIKAIADYFDVSVDFLMDENANLEKATSDKNISEFPNRIKSYALKLNELNDGELDLVFNMVDMMLKNRKE